MVDSPLLDSSDAACTSSSEFGLPCVVVDFDKTGSIFALVTTATPKSAVSKS